MTEAKPEAKKDEDKQPTFNVERIYIKDVSFEAPMTPKLFLEQWQPDIQVDLDIERNQLDEGTFEVVLCLTVTAKRKEEIALVVEIKQAGIFSMEGFTDEQIKMLSGIQCPSILYPYAQQLCSQMVHQGGYPALYLSPINFEAMYVQHQEVDAKSDA